MKCNCRCQTEKCVLHEVLRNHLLHEDTAEKGKEYEM